MACDGSDPIRPDSGARDAGVDAGDVDAAMRDGGGGACGALTLTALGVGGLSQPVQLTAPDGDDRLFVAELTTGRVRVLDAAGAIGGTFLDLSSASSFQFAGELGLNGLAFHPDYATDGRVFVLYAPTRAAVRISSFHVLATDANSVDPASEVVILETTLPMPNHPAGHLAFGEDGFLYASIGDGQSAGDDMGLAQDLGSLAGKVLRIDVDSASPYAIPTDNPFVGMGGAREEVWMYGFRVPYRFSFDPTSGDFYLGEVGDRSFEEVDYLAAGGTAGGNYGWPTVEGDGHCVATGCDPSGLVAPIFEYGHSGGRCAVMGGYVYRGSALEACHQGRYFFADYCTGTVSSFTVAEGTASAPEEGPSAPERVVSWGRDGQGELYLLGESGEIYALRSN